MYQGRNPFVPAENKIEQDYEIAQRLLDNYWNIERNNVLDFESSLLQAVEDSGAVEVFEQMQNYLCMLMKSNFENKLLFQRFLKDIEHIEIAKRQATLTPPMQNSTICENLAFKMILN